MQISHCVTVIAQFAEGKWLEKFDKKCVACVFEGCCLWLQLKKDEMKMYSVTLEEDLPVRHMKPAVVKVYDYYQTSKSSHLF